MKETFAPIPNTILRRSDLSPGSKLCYARLLQYQGKGEAAYPSITSLADELGVSRRQVMNYLRVLKNSKLVEREKKKGFRNRYILKSQLVKDVALAKGAELMKDISPSSEVSNHFLVKDISPSTKENSKRKRKDNNKPDLIITNTLEITKLPKEIKKLFVDWVDVRIMCHGKLPAQSQDGQLKRLLEIPEDLRKESLEAAIAGTWKNIGKIQKKDDDPEPKQEETQYKPTAQELHDQYTAEQEAKEKNHNGN